MGRVGGILKPGMLLLAPKDTPGGMGGTVYTVRGNAIVTYFSGGVLVEATLPSANVPEGWVVLDPLKLARNLTERALVPSVKEEDH